MSLAEAYKDGRELRRLLTGGYEEDVRQQRELKQAQITESRQRTQASKDRIALAQKSEKRVERNQLFMDLVKNKITPEIQSMKNRNASQEEFDTYSDKLLADYPDIMSVYGEKGVRFKKRNRQIESDIAVSMTKEDLLNYGIQKGSITYDSMMKQITNGGGSAVFTISVDESGKIKIGSARTRHLEKVVNNSDVTEEDLQLAEKMAQNIVDKSSGDDEEVDGEGFFRQALNFLFKRPNEQYPNIANPTPDKEAKSTSITKSENDIQSKEKRTAKGVNKDGNVVMSDNSIMTKDEYNNYLKQGENGA